MKRKVLIIIILLILIGGLIMTGIVHKAVKASRDKGYASEWNDDHEITGDTDMDQHSWLNQVIENRTDWPAGPVEGQIVWRSDLNALYIYDGSKWELCTLKTKTSYMTLPGTAFSGWNPDTDQVAKDGDEGWFQAEAGGIATVCPLTLPNGAIITAVKVYGTAPGETWYLRRIDFNNIGFATTMASGAIGAEDNTIVNPIIDNTQYAYQIETTTLDAWEEIYGVRITYTTIYI